MSQVQEVKQSLDKVKSLRERLGTGRWQEEDWGILARVLGSYERLLSTLFEAQMTLNSLSGHPTGRIAGSALKSSGGGPCGHLDR